jgi:formylglycine-generating enzyme required for sulfatase activity
LQGQLEKHLEDAGDETAKEILAKRQANAAVGLLRLDPSAKVWFLLKHSEDPRVRSYLIHRLGPMGIEPATIIKRMHEESDITIRRALIQCLGEIRLELWPSDERESFAARLQNFYQTESDPGLHASAAWLLRQWREDKWLQQVDHAWAQDKCQRQKRIETILASFAQAREKAQVLPQWYVNGQGQTMVVIPGPVDFLMGSRGQAIEPPLHRHRIRRPFAISSAAVTEEQYWRKNPPKEQSTDPRHDYPVTYKSWFEAAAYCNWLSEQEGIDRDQWCYEITAEGQVSLRKDYLHRTGYRLPTEAEMEYTNRAGAITARFYGESEELLEKYGWYVPNSKGHIWPVGSLKPNDLGFFDTHGNVWCWCQEPRRTYPLGEPGKVFEDKEGEQEVDAKKGRGVRGNCYTDHGGNIGCARSYAPPSRTQTNIIGFRVARTMKAE